MLWGDAPALLVLARVVAICPPEVVEMSLFIHVLQWSQLLPFSNLPLFLKGHIFFSLCWSQQNCQGHKLQEIVKMATDVESSHVSSNELLWLQLEGYTSTQFKNIVCAVLFFVAAFLHDTLL